MNGLSDFTRALLDGQPLRLHQWTPITELDRECTGTCLEEFEVDYRQELPFTPPPLLLDHAVWAAETLYIASHFVVYRSESPDAVLKMLRVDSPRPKQTSAAHYSVDLIFRFLRELCEQAQARAMDDVLVDEIRRLAAEWPLSSVGVGGLTIDTTEPIVSHECLLQLYVDRVVQQRDWSRLNDAHVRERLRINLGQFEDLAPEAVAALRDREESACNQSKEH